MGPPPPLAAVRLAVRRGLANVSAGQMVLVACSGGADSLALAAATAFEAPRAGLIAGAIIVDHGLQPGSARRSAELAVRLREFGLAPVDVTTVTVGAQGGPEAAARTARYAAFEETARRLEQDTADLVIVLLGHTRDDQAETVLLGLARGSGARSLAGMPAVSGRYRRPLLDVPRATTQAACRAEGLTPWQDPHNVDPAFTRVRVRHDALPALTQALGPGVPEALARTARLLRDDSDALDAWARRARNECAHPDGNLSVDALAELPAAVRRRVLHAAAIAAGSSPGALTVTHVMALDELVTSWRGQGPLHLPDRVTAQRQCGKLVFNVNPHHPHRGDQ